MSIEKMKLVNIVGPIDQYDEIVDQYMIEEEVHLENAMEVAGEMQGLYNYDLNNPYSDSYKRIMEVCEMFGVEMKYCGIKEKMSKEEIEQYLDEVYRTYKGNREECSVSQKQLSDNLILLEHLKHMEGIEVQLKHLFNLQFMRFRFGRMSTASYVKLVTFLGDINAIFLKSSEDSGYVYGMYLTPHICSEEIDGIFASLNFERIRISEKADGNPAEGFQMVTQENENIQRKIDALDCKLQTFIEENHDKIQNVYSCIKRKYEVYNTRFKAAHTKTSFYLTDWMEAGDSDAFEKTLNQRKDVIVVREEPEEVPEITPPTVIKNNRITKPFESFLLLYGLPGYYETDPTNIIAVSFAIIFGMMYGDLGQGLLLALGGFILYRIKKWALAGVAAMVGLFSAVFGVLFGSVFGNEEVFRPIWLNPMEATQNLLIAAVAIGVVFVVMAMVTNMVNALKKKNYGEFWFSQNGVCGGIFYLSAVIMAYLSIFAGVSVPVVLLLGLTILPLAFVYLKGPLTSVISGRGFHAEQGYYMETAFEMFDILLSYVTNTISFIRMGAFALVHAGMMMVVYQLAEMAGGAGFIVLIIGNLFVMAMEAFVVGIQVLRLQFYEMMGRYFEGNGKPFTSLNINKK